MRILPPRTLSPFLSSSSSFLHFLSLLILMVLLLVTPGTTAGGGTLRSGDNKRLLLHDIQSVAPARQGRKLQDLLSIVSGVFGGLGAAGINDILAAGPADASPYNPPECVCGVMVYNSFGAWVPCCAPGGGLRLPCLGTDAECKVNGNGWNQGAANGTNTCLCCPGLKADKDTGTCVRE